MVSSSMYIYQAKLHILTANILKSDWSETRHRHTRVLTWLLHAWWRMVKYKCRIPVAGIGSSLSWAAPSSLFFKQLSKYKRTSPLLPKCAAFSSSISWSRGRLGSVIHPLASVVMIVYVQVTVTSNDLIAILQGSLSPLQVTFQLWPIAEVIVFRRNMIKYILCKWFFY